MNTLSLAEKFIIPFLVLILLYLKPTRRCLATLDTFFHESFHALLSLLLGNKVKEIQFKESIEGCCKSLSKSKFATTLTALAGYERIMAAYREAVQEKYRFFSFGDCMLLTDE